MTTVITYGTYDMLHYGHRRLLERAKALGDYLIVGVTAEDFDKLRGKINVKQSLMERIEGVRATGLADKIIVEEYQGQKIDDIRRYGVDIFAIGSDWEGKFDYLNEFCQVIYLPRTENISSTQLRSEEHPLRLGVVGDSFISEKAIRECGSVNGLTTPFVFTRNERLKEWAEKQGIGSAASYEELLTQVDAVYLATEQEKHERQIRQALEMGRHVLCETPVSANRGECRELLELAASKGLILMEAIKTAYATAYNRLLLLVKSKVIGSVVSVDATCTQLKPLSSGGEMGQPSICAWGTTAMLPVLQILGTQYQSLSFVSSFRDEEKVFDTFTKIDLCYPNAVASIKVGKGVKSEGELVITGTKGYIYVPAPWWKTDYFEIRYENQNANRRYFYALEGEGIRYELLTFQRSIQNGKNCSYISAEESLEIAGILEKFYRKENLREIKIIE